MRAALGAVWRASLLEHRQKQAAAFIEQLVHINQERETRRIWRQLARGAIGLFGSSTGGWMLWVGVSALRRHRPPLRLRITPHSLELPHRRVSIEDLRISDGRICDQRGPLWDPGYEAAEVTPLVRSLIEHADTREDRPKERMQLGRLRDA